MNKHPYLTEEQVEHNRKASEARLKINEMTKSELFAAKKKAFERKGNTFTAKKVALKDIDWSL